MIKKTNSCPTCKGDGYIVCTSVILVLSYRQIAGLYIFCLANNKRKKL